jgi:hypothetical protein
MTNEKYLSLCNKQAYHIAYARLKESVSGLEAGSEYPIDTEARFSNNGEVCVMVKGDWAINAILVPQKSVELFERVFIPKYKLGDILFKIESRDHLGAFRVWEYYWDRVEIAYRDGWAVGTDLAGQAYESNIRPATKEEQGSWGVKHGDNIIKERKPELYNSILKPTTPA